jgi:Ca2+/H+ antiporter, TMEM165/GDT1 family
MRLQSKRTPLLLLLLPALALASSLDTKSSVDTKSSLDTKSDVLDDSVSGAAKPKYDVGTKDAPVDGKDGKPHDGPFVDTKAPDASGSKKELPIVEDLLPEKTITKTTSKGKDPITGDASVMDDPHRQAPKEGTTGTEGGVTEKDKARKKQETKTGEKVEKVPETPKEAPPLPHSEVEKIIDADKTTDKSDKDSTKSTTKDKTQGSSKSSKGSKSDDYQIPDKVAGLEKPNDLPGKLHDSPNPVPNSAAKDHLEVTKSGQSTPKKVWKEDANEGNEGVIQPFHSFVLSLTMILVSEIGDKTFLVAAIMAMKHDRMLVFSAAYGALVVMTVLSAVLGHAVPALIPKRFTAFLAAALFLVFGFKLLREGMAMDPEEGVGAEMQEVEMELQEKEHQAMKQGRRRSSVTPYAVESGFGGRNRKSRSQSRFPAPRSPSTSPARSPSPPSGVIGNVGVGLSNLCSLLLSPAWVQTFVMTFLGEWGDRSQIATIAMAAGQDYWWVTLGAMVGHACCTGVAVIGGKAIAGKVSLKVGTCNQIYKPLPDGSV